MWWVLMTRAPRTGASELSLWQDDGEETAVDLWPTPLASQPGFGNDETGKRGKKLLVEVRNSWPTPLAPTGGKTIPADAVAIGNSVYRQDGSKVQVDLAQAVKGNWPTPRSEGFDAGGDVSRSLPHAVKWPTPTVTGNNNRHGLTEKSGDGLGTAAKAQWPTPVAQSDNGGARGLDGGSRARATLRESYSEEETKKLCSGSLNPSWTEQLMGFPAGWTEIISDDGPPAGANPSTNGRRRGSRKKSKTEKPASGGSATP
jgi:hypothetical protein